MTRDGSPEPDAEILGTDDAAPVPLGTLVMILSSLREETSHHAQHHKKSGRIEPTSLVGYLPDGFHRHDDG